MGGSLSWGGGGTYDGVGLSKGGGGGGDVHKWIHTFINTSIYCTDKMIHTCMPTYVHARIHMH